MNPWERLQGLPEDENERLKERAKHYKAIFTSGASADFVLEDLKCNFFFYDTTADPNPTLRDLKEGNRQVVLHILKAISHDEKTEPQPEENQDG